MSKDIEISTYEKGDVSVISIKGDITALTGEAVEGAYRKISLDGAKKILLCLDRDGYINSGGIAILIGIVSEGRKRDQTIGFTGLSDHFQKIFDMVGLTKYAEIFPSEKSALENF